MRMIRPENPEYAASCERLRIAYPEELPGDRQLDEIRRLWQEHPLIIVGGDTGSGGPCTLDKLTTVEFHVGSPFNWQRTCTTRTRPVSR